MIRRQWKIAIGVGATVLVAGGAVGFAGLAGADPAPKSATYVDGYGDLTDDFGDHEGEVGVLCDGCDNSNGTDLVMLWQSILTVDGHLTVDDIDGDFGADTAEATKKWQEAKGLDADGKVGDETWGTADDELYWAEDEGSEFPIYGDYYDNNYLQLDRNDGGEGKYAYSEVNCDNGWAMNSNSADSIELFEKTITLYKD